MYKKELKTILFIALQVMILIAVVVVLSPIKWPKTGIMELALSFSNEEQQKESAPFIQISGKSGTGKTFGPIIKAFDSTLSLDSIEVGVWEITVEALDNQGTTIALAHPETIHIKHNATQPIPVILDPVWTGAFNLTVNWPTELGTFTEASLSWTSRTIYATPIQNDYQHTVSFQEQGLPVGTYSFDLHLSNAQGGSVTVPNIDTFIISGTSRSHVTILDLSDFGILPLTEKPSALQPVTLSLEEGSFQQLKLSSPDKDVLFLYHYAVDGEPMNETWTQGNLFTLPSVSSSLEVEAQAVYGDRRSTITKQQYQVSQPPVLSLAEGLYHEPISLEVIGKGVSISTNDEPFVTYSGPITLQANNTTLTAYTSEEGMLNSPFVSAVYRFETKAPTISYENGLLVMNSPTEGATICYTTDGFASKTYTKPFPVLTSTTFKAFSSLPGMLDSPPVSFTVTLMRQTPPTISLEDGTIHFQTPDSQATVWYRYAFAEGEFSPYQEGTSLVIGKGRAVSVEAYAKSPDTEPSSIARAQFPVAKAPTFSLEDGVFDHPVSLPFEKKTTYYISLDGKPYQPYTENLTIDRNTVLKAYTHQAGYVDSLPVTQIIHVRTASPTITVSKADNGNKRVTIHSATQGATILCTVENETFPYTEELLITENTHIEAFAEKDGLEKSYKASTWVEVDKTTSPNLVLTEGSEQEILLTSFEPEAQIWYRLSEKESFVTGNKIAVTPGQPLAIEAYAKSPDKQPSPKVTALFSVANPVDLSPESGFFTQPLPNKETTIWYTLNDGPLQKYDGSPLTLSNLTRIEAFRRQKGLINSASTSRTNTLLKQISLQPVTLSLKAGPTQQLLISSSDKNVLFLYRYAVDGEPMSETWTQGNLLIIPPVSFSLEVEAQAVYGEHRSPITKEQYQVCQAPVFSVPEGLYYLPLSLEMEGKEIEVSTNGGPFIAYSSPINLQTNNTTLTAYASEAGKLNSAPVSAAYRFGTTPPTISLEDETIHFQTANNQATIWYRYAFADEKFSPYREGNSLDIGKGRAVQVEAYAKESDNEPSSPVKAQFSVANAPFFSLDSEIFDHPVSLPLEKDVTYFISLDGEPYKPFMDNLTIDKNTVLKAYTHKAGHVDSLPVTQTIHIRTASPTLVLTEGDQQEILLACPDKEAQIWYRLFGEETFVKGNRVFVTSGHPLSIEAYAQAPDKQPSQTLSTTFTVANPVDISPESGFFTQSITVTMEGSGIEYTLNGGPRQAYDGLPLPLSRFARIEAFRQQKGFINSAKTSRTYSILKTIEIPQLKEPEVKAEEVPETERWKIGGTGPAGGIVFYDKGTYSDNWRYLEASPADEGGIYIWGQYGTLYNMPSVAVGSGKSNTLAAWASETDTESAIAICRNKSLTADNVVYDDWFLPSRDELQLLWKLGPKANFSNTYYWTSSENSAVLAWEFNVLNNTSNAHYKNALQAVRAIRAF